MKINMIEPKVEILFIFFSVFLAVRYRNLSVNGMVKIFVRKCSRKIEKILAREILTKLKQNHPHVFNFF